MNGRVTKLSRKVRKKSVVDTSVTIRTKYLEKEVKTLCDFNFKVALLAFLGAVLTAVTTLNDFGATILEFFKSKVGSTDIPVMETIICGLSFLMIALAIYSFIKQYKVHNPKDFVNHIIEDQFETEEFTAVFIIKGIFNNIPKILVFRSETWQSYFLPYCHYDENLGDDEIRDKVRKPLAEQLEVDESDIDVYNDFSKKEYIVIKKNPSHKSMSKINYRFFYVKFRNQYAGRKFANNNYSNYFLWKSKYELGKDMNTQLNNGDIVSIIDELSLINQSQLAFQERTQSSYEISSRYNIIWNITNECYFNCPMCATNSGEQCKSPITKQDKLLILLNLSSINGYIENLDISGGDPLKNEEDREIIKKANQILTYTDIKVTTTGRALEQLSVNEIMDTVKKCDITYDIPYEVCNNQLQEYREYYYNYYNFRQLEKFSNSGVKVELNIHIPILPVTIDESLIRMILEDIHRINPTEVKFIRLMPVGRMSFDKIGAEYKPDEFLKMVSDIIHEKKYKLNISYNCSLGVRMESNISKYGTIRKCGMLNRKLGIDCEGRVYACIWGAYIKEFAGDNYVNNPFYLGDLKEKTMFDILTSPSTLKYLKNLEKMEDGCRVCAYINERKTKSEEKNRDDILKIMFEAKDPLNIFHEYETKSYDVSGE